MKIELLDIKLCEPSPLLAHVPLESEVITNLSADRKHAETAAHLAGHWAAWAEDIATRGVDDPGKFYREDGICYFVDGRNRLHAAKLGGLLAFPGVEVEKTEASTIALASLAHRKGTTKGALAYLALTLHPYLVGQGKGRKKEKHGERAFLSLAQLAASIGVGTTTMDDAAETFEFLSDHPDQRATMEPRILAGIVGVGAAKSGAASAAATKGSTLKKDLSLSELEKTLGTFATQISSPMGEATKKEVIEAHRKLVEKCPHVREIWLSAMGLEGGAS